jgi:hypothetical protein
MTIHIKIDGISLCRYELPLAHYLSASDNHVSLVCQPVDKKEAQGIVDFLWSIGYNAEIVEGKCDQRDLGNYFY